MFAEERRRTGRTKERSVIQFGLLVIQILSSKPSYTYSLLFHIPHLSTGAQAVTTIKRVLGHK